MALKVIDATGDENDSWLRKIGKKRKNPKNDRNTKVDNKVKKSYFEEKYARVAGTHGDRHYLVELPDGRGVVVDATSQKMYDPFNMDYLLSEMYWTNIVDMSPTSGQNIVRDDIRTVLKLVSDELGVPVAPDNESDMMLKGVKDIFNK